MINQNAIHRKGNSGAKTVVHARIGSAGMETLHELASRQGLTVTQALRDLLSSAQERMAEEAFGSRLDSIARSLTHSQEQQNRHAARIEALVSILRAVEIGQQEREAQIIQSIGGLVEFSRLICAHLFAMVEVSSRAQEISRLAQDKLRLLKGGDDGHH